MLLVGLATLSLLVIEAAAARPPDREVPLSPQLSFVERSRLVGLVEREEDLRLCGAGASCA